jgi:hypothetical protein
MRVPDFVNGLRVSKRPPGAGVDAPQQALADAPVAKTRRRLFTKYVALFVAVVCIALVSNGVFDVFFYYQEHKASLIRIQREQAEAAAAKIGQFIKEIESQLGWTTQLPWSAGSIEQRASMPCGCYAKCPPLPSWLSSTPPAKSGCEYRGSPWTWSRAVPTSPTTPSSRKR